MKSSQKKETNSKEKNTAQASSLTSSLNDEQLLKAFRCMVRARKVDEKAIVLYKQNKCHFQIGCAGHEAVQVAAAHALKPGYDWAYPYYRDMAFSAALGLSDRDFFLGILNKPDDPCSGGRQMPMHYGHKDLNIVSQSSPTGTQFLQALGCALALKWQGKGQVAYVSAGEGTTSQGAYHEMLNWAAREKAPLIVLIQDNRYAISVHISEQVAGCSVANISSGYEGLAIDEVNGLNYLESFISCKNAVERARKGEGPTVIVADVIRLQSHSISDNQSKYRSAEELAAEKNKDPISLFSEYLVKQKVLSQGSLDSMLKEIQAKVDAAASWAESQADHEPSSCLDHVVVYIDPGAGVTENIASGETMFMVDALNQALVEEMDQNPQIVVYGQDVAGEKGGVFSVTSGLTKRFGQARCFNGPLAEESLAGSAVGMATVGLKPVIEIQFGDYIWTAMMQIKNELVMMHYRSNGSFRCPVVIRTAVGGYIRGGLYHSQNIEATFGHTPGLIVILPSNATDAKGLLKSAIRANDPVLFLEHKGLYRQVYAKGAVGGKDDLIPIGRAKIVREGQHATIVTWGALVNKSLIAAKSLAHSGYEVEVIDIRTIAPLDTQTIVNSVKKTGRVLIAHEDILFMGFGAEIAAHIAQHAFEYLDAPVMRVGGPFAPIPHSPILENAVLPQDEDVIQALEQLLAY